MKNFFLILGFLISNYCIFNGFASDELFTVRNITIEESSSSSSDAKQIGIDKAKKEAFKKILKKIMLSHDAKEINYDISLKDINNLVSEIKITDEQTSSTKYKANIDISFGSSLIGKYLQDKGYKFITDSPANTLIIPIIIGNDEKILYPQTENLIKTINNYISDSDNVIPIITPKINLKNTLDMAIKKDLSKINQINESYNTITCIIAKVTDLSNMSAKLDILKIDTDSSEEVRLSFTNNSNIYGVLSYAIIQTANDIYKKDIMNSKGYTGEVISVFAIKSINDVLRIEKLLSNIKYVSSVFTKAVSQNMIQINIKTKGHKKSIVNSLIEKGFFVEDKENYILVR